MFRGTASQCPVSDAAVFHGTASQCPLSDAAVFHGAASREWKAQGAGDHNSHGQGTQGVSTPVDPSAAGSQHTLPSSHPFCLIF